MAFSFMSGLYDRASHTAVVKMFHTVTEGVPETYPPAKFVSVGKGAITGNPDLDRAGTRHVERKNGTLCGSRGLLMPSLKSGTIRKRRWRCIMRTVTFAGFTAHCGSRQRWQRELPITYGICPN